MKTITFPEIVVKNRKPHVETGEDIDTGVSDGSGEISVRAGDVIRVGNDSVFRNVVVELTDHYADWEKGSVRMEAKAMLMEDYTCSM